VSKKANHNSIIFLTTLSVYLGLVLVGGAAAPVLAHSAMTRGFDIKNEIVFEDDLDKKPDDDENLDFAQSLESYFDNVEDFLKDLKKLQKIEKFNLDYDKFDVVESGFVPCNVDGDPIRQSTQKVRVNNRWLEAAVTDARYRFENYNFLSDCLDNGEFEKHTSTSSTLKFSYNENGLNLEISAPKLTKQRADFLAEKFNQAAKVYEIDEASNLILKIHENTSFKSENNQVFIVTRLPRGSIDALLAEKDAQ